MGWAAQAVGAAIAQRHPRRFWPVMATSLTVAGLVAVPQVRPSEIPCRRAWLLGGGGAGVAAHLLFRGAARLAVRVPALGPHLERLRSGAESAPPALAALLTLPSALGEELYWRELGAGPTAGALGYVLAQVPSGNPLLPLGALPLGLLGRWLQERSGSITPPLLAHLTFSELTLVRPGLPRDRPEPGARLATEP